MKMVNHGRKMLNVMEGIASGNHDFATSIAKEKFEFLRIKVAK